MDTIDHPTWSAKKADHRAADAILERRGVGERASAWKRQTSTVFGPLDRRDRIR